jgi:hypothetical protein
MAFPSVLDSSSYLLGVLFGSRLFLTLRWMMPEMILGEVASRSDFTWRLSLPTWVVNVDGLACPLHQPMACSYWVKGQSLPTK